MTDETSAPEPSFREEVEQAEAQTESAAPEESAELETPEPQAEVRKVVPLSALHEERNRVKQLRQQNEETQRNFAALQQQQMQMMQYLAQREQAAQAPKPPDETTDPLGALSHGVKQTQAQLAYLAQNQQRDQWQRNQEQQAQNFVHGVTSAEQQFTAKQPDYQQAVNYLKSIKQREYEAAGMDQQQAFQAVQRDAMGLSQACMQRGENPAERAYEIAKTFGYKPQANAEDKIAMQQAGQRASTPSGGAGQGGGKLSLDALAKMDPKDFLKATSGDKWKKLMGG